MYQLLGNKSLARPVLLICLLVACTQAPDSSIDCVFAPDLSILEQLRQSNEIRQTSEVEGLQNLDSGWVFNGQTLDGEPVRVQRWTCNHSALLAEWQLEPRGESEKEDVKKGVIKLANWALTPELTQSVALHLDRLPEPTADGNRMSIEGTGLDDFYILLTRSGPAILIEIGWTQS